MKETDLNWIERVNALIGGIFLIGSLYWMSWKLTLSILTGFLVVGANFWFLKKIILAAFYQGVRAQGSKLKLGVALAVKYLLLFVSVGLSIIYFDLHMIVLLVGISTLVISIMTFAIKQSFLV
ncbi:MAG: ATP synthase subunit I [Deltaproteobacteria bacterium]|nr:ATP synthase subunit I [Deltaproteobacteria bacterium]